MFECYLSLDHWDVCTDMYIIQQYEQRKECGSRLKYTNRSNWVEQNWVENRRIFYHTDIKSSIVGTHADIHAETDGTTISVR